jgi:hypothetical protein
MSRIGLLGLDSEYELTRALNRLVYRARAEWAKVRLQPVGGAPYS